MWELRESGEEVRALARVRSAPGTWRRSAARSVRPTCSSQPSPGARGGRRRLLPRPLDGPRRGGEFAARDHQGAENFAAAAAAAGVAGSSISAASARGSEHLASRHATAEALRAGPVPVTYFRAAAVVGAGSESFRTVFYLVRRLPVMITPALDHHPTQPIAISDAVGFLAAPRTSRCRSTARSRSAVPTSPPMAAWSMSWRAAWAGARRCAVTVPVLTPGLSSLWIGLVTPVDAGVARPLIEGLATETVVTDAGGMELFSQIRRTPLSKALSEAAGSAEP